MDMMSIQAAVTSLKTASDIVATFIKLKPSAEIQSKVIELNAVILSAQSSALAANSEQFALLKKVSDLEKEIARIKAWEAEKQKYELHEFKSGLFAYGLKADAKGTQPNHQLCANCYEHEKKSILQKQLVTAGRMTVLLCPNCQTKLTYHGP
jgi:ribosomal protein L29